MVAILFPALPLCGFPVSTTGNPKENTKITQMPSGTRKKIQHGG